MKIYLAGKIRKQCWRHAIVKDLHMTNGNIAGGTCPDPDVWDACTWPILPKAVFGAHDYVGPYFFSCDHGCWHRTPHAAADNVRDRRHVVTACKKAIASADVVFAIGDQDGSLLF
jgi:hypothetical protein